MVSWINILRNIFTPRLTEESFPANSYCFSRGSVALYFGVIAALKGKTGHLWVPGYFCDEVLEPLRKTGIKIFFYPVGLDMLPDWQRFPKVSDSNSVHKAFLLVHYFGFNSDKSIEIDFCKQNGLVLIEDKAHCLEKIIKNHEFITIYSPRKQIGLASGGLLILPDDFVLNEYKTLVELSVTNTLNWFFKRYLRLLVFKSEKLSRFLRSKNILSNNTHLPLERMNNLSIKIMTDFYSRSLEKAISKRRANYKYISNNIKGLQLFDEFMNGLTETGSPFMISVFINGDVKKIKRHLNRVGIPAASWPDLPHEVINNPGQFKNTHYLYNKLLHLPVHQDLSRKQLNFINITLKSLNHDFVE